jgi:hypothetical protein
MSIFTVNPKIGAWVIFGLMVIANYITVKRFKNDKLTVRLLLLWLAIWSSVGFFAIFPQLLDYLKNLFNIGNRIYFLIYIAMIILLLMIFNMASTITRLTRKLMQMAQEIAILNLKLEEMKNNRNNQNNRKDDPKTND